MERQLVNALREILKEWSNGELEIYPPSDFSETYGIENARKVIAEYDNLKRREME